MDLMIEEILCRDVFGWNWKLPRDRVLVRDCMYMYLPCEMSLCSKASNHLVWSSMICFVRKVPFFFPGFIEIWMRQVWQFILLHILLRHVFASILRSLRFAISTFAVISFLRQICTKSCCNEISPSFCGKTWWLMLVSMKFYVRLIRQRLPERNHNQSQHWHKFPPKPQVFFGEGLSRYQVSWETCNDCNRRVPMPIATPLGIDTWGNVVWPYGHVACAPGRQLAWLTSNYIVSLLWSNEEKARKCCSAECELRCRKNMFFEQPQKNDVSAKAHILKKERCTSSRNERHCREAHIFWKGIRICLSQSNPSVASITKEISTGYTGNPGNLPGWLRRPVPEAMEASWAPW